MYFLALTDEKGPLIWISAARPGRTHDITAARRDHLLAQLRAAALGALADLGFLGLDDDPDDPVVVTGFKATRYRKLTTCEKDANRALAAGHAPVEHGFAHLKNWRTLTKLRTDPARATHLLRALLVQTNLEVHRGQVTGDLRRRQPPTISTPTGHHGRPLDQRLSR
ncbi:transposase family protein [Streptomyces sp. NPDC058470]|uniref:transposase family protein n=1 Tax=Streptomyces sp. NPDC058470 TaxID=3346515 RepID=UPI003652CFD3